MKLTWIRIRAAISIVLSFSIASQAMAAAAQAPQGMAPMTPTQQAAQFFAKAPFEDQLMSRSFNAPKMGPYNANDPILDADPYFMRSEKWRSANRNSSGSSIVSHSQGRVTIQINKSSRALEINAPLKPLFETDEFLLFKGSPELFAQKGSTADEPGEGLFFIDKTILHYESVISRREPRPVPIFFLPLAGEGWTGRVTELSNENLQLLTLQSEHGDVQTLELHEIRQLAMQYQTNILSITLRKLRYHPEIVRASYERSQARKEGIEIPYVDLPRGSTAVFGAFQTGLNLENPEQAEAKTITPFKFDPIGWLLPKANADLGLSPDLVARLTVLGAVVGTTFVAGLYSQYTILRGRMLERRKTIEANRDAERVKKGLPPIVRSGRLYPIKREAIEIIDVFTHGLTTLGSGIGIAVGHLLEYGSDRFFGREGASPHGLLRKFLEYTFLKNREQSEDVPSNAKTLWLGGAVLGGVDTGFVVYQLLYTSPVFFPWVASKISEDMHERVSHQFSGNDAANESFITSEILRNGVGYGLNGASSYSSDQKQIFMEQVTPEVHAAMRAQGKNPAAAEYKKEASVRVEARVEKMLIERGLPGNDEFIFGAPSVARAVAHFMGFKVNREAFGLGQNEGSFIFEEARWGLRVNAFKKAIKQLNDLYALTGDQKALSAASLLKDLLQKSQFVLNMAKHPTQRSQNWSEMRRANQITTMMSNEDGEEFSGLLKYTDIWPEAASQPEAGALATKFYRLSLFSMVQGKPHLLKPNSRQIYKHMKDVFGDETKAEIDARLDATMGDQPASDLDREIAKLEIVASKIEAEDKEKVAASYEPPRRDWLAKFQHARAEAAAFKAVREARLERGESEIGKDADIYSDVDQAVFREEYRRKLTRVVNLQDLTPQESELVRSAENAAAEQTIADLKTNEGMQRYVAKLSPYEQMQFLAANYADYYTKKYTELTVSNSTVVSLVSPEQPGVFQRFRQPKSVGHSKFTNMIARAAASDNIAGKALRNTIRLLESPMDPSAYSTGINPWLRRNIPLYNDVIKTITLKSRTIITAMSVGYLANQYIWQITMPWTTALWFSLAASVLMVSKYWLDRMMISVGIRSMESMTSKLVYAVIYSWITYPSYIPFFFWLQDFKNFTAGISGVEAGAAGAAIAATAAGVQIVRRSAPDKSNFRQGLKVIGGKIKNACSQFLNGEPTVAQ